MVKMSYDVVKRWVNEAQEAASSDNIMVQVGRTNTHGNSYDFETFIVCVEGSLNRMFISY